MRSSQVRLDETWVGFQEVNSGLFLTSQAYDDNQYDAQIFRALLVRNVDVPCVSQLMLQESTPLPADVAYNIVNLAHATGDEYKFCSAPVYLASGKVP